MPRIIKVEVSELRIPFNVTFAHASASRKETQSIWVRVTTACGLVGYGEGCPREYVTSESLGTAKLFIKENKNEVIDSVLDLQSLSSWVAKHEAEIDTNPAAWCALELALLDMLAKHNKCSVEALLGISTRRETFQYTAVLGNSTLPVFQKQFKQYQQMEFNDYKVKLSGHFKDDKSKLDLIIENIINPHIRIDANNLWKNEDEVVDYIRSLDVPLVSIEEPISPGQYANLAKISRALGISIILDESFQRYAQLSHLKEEAGCWVLNIRISKMGGLLRSLKIIDKAKKIGIPIIIGAHVGETSLLTRAGIVIAQASENQLIAQEGAFGTYLLKYDVCENPLMFSRHGYLTDIYTNSSSSGLGLQCNYNRGLLSARQANTAIAKLLNI